MPVSYLAPGFEQLPTELQDKYVAGISTTPLTFDQQASAQSLQVKELQDWDTKIVRFNEHDNACDYEANLATAKTTAASLLNHEGNLIEAFSSAGIYTMVAGLASWLCSALGPIDRDPTIRSLFDAVGFPIVGSGGLYHTLGLGTGDGWGVDRSVARQAIYEIAIFHDWTGSLGGVAKPGPTRESVDVRALITGIFAYMDAMLGDYITRTGINDPAKKVIIQPFNGPENFAELTINPWWKYTSPYGYFGEVARDLKQSIFSAAWFNATGERFWPSIDAGDSQNDIDTWAFLRLNWFAAWVCEKVHGNRNASNVILTQSIHHYRQGQWRPRWVGNPASEIVTEFNVSRRYLEARSNATERSGDSSNDDYDADDSYFVTVPTGVSWTICFGDGNGSTATVSANASSATVRTALETLPGIPLSDLTVEQQWANVTPISSYHVNPAGVAMYGYHIRMGQTGTPDSKSKFKRSAGRIWSPNATVEVHQYMRGGEVDRGPALKQFVRDSVALGRKVHLYHCPQDTRVLRLWQKNDGSTRLVRGSAATPGTYEWFRAGNHPDAVGAKPRGLHIAGPLLEDEPLHAKFMPWFGREMRRLNG